MSRSPSRARLYAEVRAVPEFVRFQAARGDIARLPRGDGHPVIVYPGLLAGDLMTLPLRATLTGLGYAVSGWGAGFNTGLKDGLLDAMLGYLDERAPPGGPRASLVGWSLGGLYARELAKRRPDRVRRVITLGTPCTDMRANNAWPIYESLNDHKVTAPPIDTRLQDPPPVPLTSIYSTDDGIVSAHSSIAPDGPDIENVAVTGSHMGLIWNPSVVAVLADRLARADRPQA